jgi:dolichol kinase
MIDIQREVITALGIAGIYLLVFFIGETVRRLIPSNTEISRKAVHLLGGLIAISFPYLFISHWTVLALSVSFCAIVLITKNKGILKSVHDIERKSYGSICYPAAIYLIFLLSSTKPVIYFISILVMAVSDPIAALVGRKYGVIKFDVEGNLKSIEGSIAFFCVTFLCIHLPLLLLTNIGRTESVLIALITALLVTGFEAISLSGSDNIIVPFTTYFILAKFIDQPLNVVVWQTELLLILIATGIIMYIPLRLSKASGLIVMIILNYAALSMCSYYWFLPLFLAQILYYLLILSFVHYEGKEKVASFQVKVLLYIGIIPAIFLFIASNHKDHIYVYLPYLTSITAQLAIICNYYFANYISRPLPLKADNYLKHHGRVLEIVCSVATTLFIAGMPIYFYKTNHRLNSLIIVAVGTWVAYVLNFTVNNYYRSVKDNIFDYRWRFVSAAIGIACVFLLQEFISV